MRIVRGRLAAVSVRAAFSAGAWAGFVLGLLAGGVLGALLVWVSGAVLDWQRDLGLTLGIARNLLPFGAQLPALRWISSTWYLVVPIAALLGAVLLALAGGFIGALIAASYNRSPRHAGVAVELPDDGDAEAVEEVASGYHPTSHEPPARDRPMTPR